MLKILACIVFTSILNFSYAQLFGGQIKTNKTWANSYPSGSIFCASGPTAIVEVTNPTTGKVWMDRNLGSSQAGTSSTDINAIGDLYQWGRRSDGHQCRNSPTTTTLSSSDMPVNNFFIISSSCSGQCTADWRSPQSNNLWQGVNGINNPCPIGYRIPTSVEWNNELNSWWIATSVGAFSSPLKLVTGGYRNNYPGNIYFYGTPLDVFGSPQYGGYYWSSTPVFSNNVGQLPRWESNCLIFHPQYGDAFDYYSRAMGFSVRCIKN
jgi:uncharacterized protein (TIGR02145 family)